MMILDLIELKERIDYILKDDSISSKEVKILLKSELTTHNADAIKKIVDSYYRNR